MSAPAQITILIPDPDEMMFVTGNNDTNIDRIEREFAVKIVSRGAELRIMGEPANVARVGELVSAMRTLSDRPEATGREDLAEERLRSAKHKGQWRDFDLATLHRAREALGRHELVQRVIERTQIRIDLLREIARKEAEPLPRLDRGTREDEACHLAIAQSGNTHRDREIGVVVDESVRDERVASRHRHVVDGRAARRDGNYR